MSHAGRNGGGRGWKSVRVSEGDHPGTGKGWGPGPQPGCGHGFIHHVAELLRGPDPGRPARPDFKDGLATDVDDDAVLSSGKSKQWTHVKQVRR